MKEVSIVTLWYAVPIQNVFFCSLIWKLQGWRLWLCHRRYKNHFICRHEPYWSCVEAIWFYAHCLSNISRLVVVYMPSDNENSSLKQRWRKTIKNTYLSFRHHSICIASRPSLRSHSANFEIGKDNTRHIVSIVSISVWPVLHLVISTSRSGSPASGARSSREGQLWPDTGAQMLTFIERHKLPITAHESLSSQPPGPRCYLWYFIGTSKTPALQSE